MYSVVKSWIRVAQHQPVPFDVVLEKMREDYETPAPDMLSFRRRTTKHKGDTFEVFCLIYLQSLGKYDDVWLLKDVPNDVLNHLKLKRRDMGIDLIAVRNGKYTAIQAKYKKPTKNGLYNRLSWKACSTFYALASRTGPYERVWVMTTAKSVCRAGTKTRKDYSTCLAGFRAIPKSVWSKMADNHGYLMNPDADSTYIDIRKKRLAYYETK